MDYSVLARQIEALAEEEPWYVPLLANASAVLYEALPDLNWLGFYLVRGGSLVLGPFQGKVACIHIPRGRGVCGTALAEDRTVVVPDVHAFPGHIACDSASRSEIVIPLRVRDQVAAVLDVDSPLPARFGEAEREGLEAVVRMLERHIRME
ncbi:MAG: GAF domain-containing protein [Clostridia bacterium]|nr:GAF domain-containing protein [Clostridia bacterium]